MDEDLGTMLSPDLLWCQGWEGRRNTVAPQMKEASPFPTTATAVAQAEGDACVCGLCCAPGVSILAVETAGQRGCERPEAPWPGSGGQREAAALPSASGALRSCFRASPVKQLAALPAQGSTSLRSGW